MNASEIKNILDLHIKWLRDEEGSSRADLRGADLRGAYLREADGMISFGPVGETKLIGYAWLDKDGKAVIMLGCHVGNLKDTVEAIRSKYGAKSNYENVVKACVKSLEEQK